MPRIFKTTTTSKKLSRVSPFARLRDVADDVELLSTALDAIPLTVQADPIVSEVLPYNAKPL